MSESTPRDCPIHEKRLGDLEGRAEVQHVKTHKLDNTVTEVKMKTELLEQDHEHLKRDFWHALGDLKEISAGTTAALSDQLKANHSAALERQRLRDDHKNTDKILRWILGFVTLVGAGTTIAVLARLAAGGTIS